MPHIGDLARLQQTEEEIILCVDSGETTGSQAWRVAAVGINYIKRLVI